MAYSLKILSFSRQFISYIVITGFNTDIQYQGIIYHVQTEDKGLDNPLILSLIYNGGTILASKRSSYSDLLNAGLDEKVLADRLQKQHKLMCAAIRAGRIEDLKRMTMRESVGKQKGLVAQKQTAKPKEEKSAELHLSEKKTQNGKNAFPPKKIEDQSLLELPPTVQQQPIDLFEALAPKKNSTQNLVSDPKNKVTVPEAAYEDEIIIEAVEIIEEEIILPSEAVKILNTSVKTGNAADSRLKIEFTDDITFKGGDRKTINIVVCRGNKEKLISGAHVTIKVLGSSFRPLIFHSRTDNNGLAVVHVQLPHFRSGRAAILVRAMVSGEEAEARRIIQQG